MLKGPTSRTRRGQGASQGRGESERGIMCLGYVTVASVESLGHRAPMGSVGLEFYKQKALSYQWLADAGCCLVGQAKQMGS